MRLLALPIVVLVVLLAAPASALAGVAHTVTPGETLWSIAAANNFTTRALAAANGLPEDGHVVLGSTLTIPSVPEAAAALSTAGAAGTVPPGASAAGSSSGTGSSASGSSSPAASSSAMRGADGGAPPPQGAYTVRVGDTLSALAVRSGTSVGAIAAMNGLDLSAPLVAGTALKLPAGSAPAAAAAGPAPQAVPQASPAATPGRVGAGDVTSIAARNGAPGSLAAAIAWQESGFSNAMVSSANARGVMQVMPGTWDWVQQNLAARRLDPSSATDNVHAGTLYLARLLRDAGGDENLAAAGYYQGLSSVRRIGMLPETQRYVANVMALRSRFGG